MTKLAITLIALITWQLSASANVTLSGPVSVAGPALVNGNGQFVAAPVASFTASTNLGLPTLSVTFTDTSSNTPIAWDWDFGDGTAHSTSQNPSHNFTASGLFTVTLLSSNAGGNSSANSTVKVAWDVASYIDFETGTTGDFLTATILTNSTHGSLGAWSLGPNAAAHSQISSHETALRTPAHQGTTFYDDTGSTRGLDVDIANVENYAMVTLASDAAAMSVGCWIKPASISTTFQTIDYIAMHDIAGKFAVAQSGASFGLHAHGVLAGVTQVGPDITWTAGTLYWLSLGFVKGSPGTVTVNLYTQSGSLVGTSSCGTDAADIHTLLFGRTDNHSAGSQPPSAMIQYDDFLISIAGTFPLGP